MQASFEAAVSSLSDDCSSSCRSSLASLAWLELLVVIAMKRLQSGKEVCNLDMIWREYEAFLKQAPELPCRYSRPVFHKVCSGRGMGVGLTRRVAVSSTSFCA